MNKNSFIINPLWFFGTGFFYYLLVPYFSFLLIPDFKEFTPLEASFGYIDISFFTFYYFFDLFLISVSFYVGYLLSWKIPLNQQCHFDQFSNSAKIFALTYALILILLLWVIYSYIQENGKLFSGYKTFNIQFLGQISTLTFLTFFFTNFFSNKTAKRMLFILVLLEIMILLGLGSRNIVVNGVITLILGYLLNNRNVLYSIKFYIFSLSFIFLVLFIGVWRTGYEYKIQTLIGIFLSEPMFVLSSASVYLNTVLIRPIINLPYEIFLSIINFIPTFIFPEKVHFINTFMSDKQKFSPFGASSILINLYTNFGYFYFLYVMSIGFYFGYLYRKATNSVFFRTIYFSSLPLILFQFYNQYMYSFFKLLFWNAFLFPFLIFYFFSKFKRF